VAFWASNLAVSLTPIAAAYRSAMSIDYLPMLGESAVGGAILAAAVSLALVRRPERVPGAEPVRQALLLCGIALVLLTILVEVPAKVTSGVAEPGHWLAVATAFNAVRILALGVGVGLTLRSDHPEPHRTKVKS
jgi:hypothetical protein